MVMFSKYFHQVVQFKTCIDICHAEPNHNCLRSVYENFSTTIGGCTIFVLPLSLVRNSMMTQKRNDSTVNSHLMSIASDRNEGQEFERRCFETKYEIIYGFIRWCMAD